MAQVTIVDASVLIAHLDVDDASHERAGKALADATGRLLASALTFAEVLAGPARCGKAEDVSLTLRHGLGVDAVPFDEHSPVRLAELRALTGLSLPDCCVLLAAEHAEASEILTFDARLARAATELGLSN